MKSKTEKSQEEIIDDDILVSCDDIIRFFMADGLRVMALQGMELQIKKGEILGIIGKSGSGKSTLLNMIGCLDSPTAGKLYISGRELSTMSPRMLGSFRKNEIGFVWQNPLRNLFTYMTVIENVMAPMTYTKLKRSERRRRAEELLRNVGMGGYEKSYPLKLSGGQQQRVAIAVALANNPKLLLADEPTGAVDRKTAGQIMELFSRLREETGITIVIVTHDSELAKMVDRVVEISDGRVSSEQVRVEAGFDSEAETESFSVLDKSGRVRLDEESLKKAGISGKRVRIEAGEDGITIRPE